LCPQSRNRVAGATTRPRVATPDGTIYFAAENTAGGLDRHFAVVNGQLQLGPSILANWGTFIGQIRP
jgi:hypothetical protein